jgi:Spx/MgsR family transcriptional regulator
MLTNQDNHLITVKVYGIPNCDTIKKTISWLKENKVAVAFHDYKKEGITKEKLSSWCKQVGWQTLLNKQSATWRGLSAELQSNTLNEDAAIELMIENTSIIKRPVLEIGKTLLVGFNENELTKAVNNK